MVDYREILRLHSLRNSQRSIARDVQSSRDTVADTIAAAKTASVFWPLDDDVTNEDIQEVLFPGKYAITCAYTVPDYPWIHRELARNEWNQYHRANYTRDVTPARVHFYQYVKRIMEWKGHFCTDETVDAWSIFR